jgi:hypothetical protein
VGGALRLEKPWGYELVWEVDAAWLGRIVHVNQGHRVWLDAGAADPYPVVLCAGRMLLVFEDDAGQLREVPLAPGHLHDIPVSTRHRMIALEDTDLVSVTTGDQLDRLRVED